MTGKGNIRSSAQSNRNVARVLRGMFRTSLVLIIIMIESFQLVHDGEKEYKLKAAFIYNFIQYIDWSVTSPKEYVVGILGSSPVENDLKEIAASKTVGDKKIVVRRFLTVNDISDCNILFITRENSGSLDAALLKTAKGTLVIAEKPGCAKKGAAVNFVVADNKLKFEINQKAVAAEGLKASSQLLKLAIIVDD
jgi:hypothetical protein